MPPRQSTRHKYRTRREKNAATARTVRLVLLGVALVVIVLLVANWRDIYNYLRTYFT